MKTVLKGFVVLLLAGFVIAGLLVSWYLRWDEIEAPALPGKLAGGSLEHDGINRTWQAYVPSSLSQQPALLFLLHGSTGDGSYMRASTFYSFDVLAERSGFIAVYPDGFQRHWNDCRAGASYAANVEDIDDTGFLWSLAEKLGAQYGADLSRVYVAGISNGGQLAYRMALESPERVAGIAAIAASLPVSDNLDCQPSERAVATLIINGTEDPVNPYRGGLVSILGDSSRGEVRSSEDTALYWARLAGHGQEASPSSWPVREPDDPTSIESREWDSPAGPPVQLLTVVGGGHTIPHPLFRLPRILGPTSHQIDTAEVIWTFFSGGVPVNP